MTQSEILILVCSASSSAKSKTCAISALSSRFNRIFNLFFVFREGERKMDSKKQTIQNAEPKNWNAAAKPKCGMWRVGLLETLPRICAFCRATNRAVRGRFAPPTTPPGARFRVWPIALRPRAHGRVLSKASVRNRSTFSSDRLHLNWIFRKWFFAKMPFRKNEFL